MLERLEMKIAGGKHVVVVAAAVVNYRFTTNKIPELGINVRTIRIRNSQSFVYLYRFRV